MISGRRTLFMVVIMTVLIGLILSAFLTWQATGFGAAFLRAWADRFVSTYVIVLPTVLIVAPLAQSLAARLDAAFATGADPGPSSPRDTVLAAWKACGAGHNGASFEPWFNCLRDDVAITMPLGQFRGENRGIAAAREIYGAIAAAIPRLTYRDPIRISEAGNTVVLEFDCHGTISGYAYKNSIAASFDVIDGKIAAYREYFGDIDPAVVAVMSSPTNTRSAAAR